MNAPPVAPQKVDDRLVTGLGIVGFAGPMNQQQIAVRPHGIAEIAARPFDIGVIPIIGYFRKQE